jgi:hypothetical protein
LHGSDFFIDLLIFMSTLDFDIGDQSWLNPDIAFEDMPLEEACRMARGPRLEPLLYDTLRTKPQSLSGEAIRVDLGPKIRPERMKKYINRIARELNVPVTVRRVPAGVIFWRSMRAASTACTVAGT